MEEGAQTINTGPRGILQSFASPSTLPHFLLLMANTGFLYVIMKADWGGLATIGSSVFLSLSVTYCFAAILAPSRLGNKLFRVDDDGKGVLNSSYWLSSLLALLPIGITVALVSATILTQLESENLTIIAYLMASIFVLMSIGQALSLTFGSIAYATKRATSARPSRVGVGFTAARIAFSVAVFIPLVWWFGYGADDLSERSLTTHATWIGFLAVVGLVTVTADRYTNRARSVGGMDGLAADRLMLVMVLAICWHLLSAWRRNPLLVDSTTGSMLIEEGILMAVTILLAVWSMANRGHKKGWRIFQGQSAVFWGIGFGYAYGGSIASLTVLSEGSLLTTTSGGHLLTATVMLAILPLAISRIGKPTSAAKETGIEITNDTESPEGSSIPPTSALTSENEMRGIGERGLLESDWEDVVELVD
mgnify:CR=1 FL=1